MIRNEASRDCKVCKLVRSYLYFAVPLLIMIAYGETRLERMGRWFSNVQLIDLLAYGSLGALGFVVCFKFLHEIYLPRKRDRRLQSLFRQTFDETVDDPLDPISSVRRD